MYYTDSTPPATYTGSMKTGISGSNTGVKYALYEDTATWDAWYDWANVNGYDNTGSTTYSSRALRLVGYWPTMQKNSADIDNGEDDNTTQSFMCITSSSKGGVCMEAIIGDSENVVNTWYLGSSDIATKLTTPQSGIDLDPTNTTLNDQTTNYMFSTNTLYEPALTLVEETPTSPVHFKSFKVANCSLSTVKMDCTNWVVKSSKEDAASGLVNWSAG